MNEQKTKNRQISEAELLQIALESFGQNTGLKTEIERNESHQGTSDIDAVIQIQAARIQYRYQVEVRNALTPAFIGRLMQQLPEPRDEWLLVTRYVSKETANLLQSLNLQYLDTVGNAYLSRGALCVRVTGQAPRANLARRDIRAPFGEGILKVIFALLSNDALHLQPFREIAIAADVSLGTVSNAMTLLEKKGYLLELGERGRKLVETSKLVEEWVEGYAAIMRPKMLVGRYSLGTEQSLRKEKLRKLNVQWGGESAASHLVDYLIPGIITIYAGGQVNELLLALRLRIQSNGPIEVRKRFWNFETESEFTPPLLTYADLLATGEARNMETARIIYDKFIRTRIARD